MEFALVYRAVTRLKLILNFLYIFKAWESIKKSFNFLSEVAAFKFAIPLFFCLLSSQFVKDRFY